MGDGPHARPARMADVDRWVELECPVCGNDCFDGQGHEKTADGWTYRHRCGDCTTIILTPVVIDGEVVGTR